MADMTFTSRRSPVLGRRGMVATSQPLAVAAGLEILAQGGNAADAAVATAAALNVTEPTSTGIGGDCFALYYEADTRQITALNGSGRAPGGPDPGAPAPRGLSKASCPHSTPIPSPCPGPAPAGATWSSAMGDCRSAPSWRPPSAWQKRGFPWRRSPPTSGSAAQTGSCGSAPGGLELTIDGRSPRAGEIFRNPGLARTLKTVAQGGKAAFYQGEIAEAIADTVQPAGGCLA